MSLHVLILTSLLTGWASSGIAQTTSSTPPIGFIRKDCPANSDTRVSIPLERQAVYIGPVQEASSNVITVQGSPWTDDEFKFAAGTQDESYYVLVLSGANAGRNYDVTSNSSNTLTVDVGTDSLDSISIGDRIKLLPHWTLSAAFPSGSGVDPSTNVLQRRTELLVQDDKKVGINNSSVETFYYTQASSWQGLNSGAADAAVLPPHKALVVRNSSLATSPVFVGVVPSATQTLVLRIPAGGQDKQQDNPVSLLRPVPVKLNDSGLDDTVFRPSSLPISRTDEILVFDDDAEAINKSSKFTYYKWAGKWRRLDRDANYDAGEEEIFTPGTGVIIRKSGTGAATEQVVYWTHEGPTL